jgi:hypothetical protein
LRSSARAYRVLCLLGRRHTPDAIADVIRHQQSAATVDRDADRTAEGIALVVEEAGENLFGLVAARPPTRERDEDYAVAGRGLAIP